MAADHCDLLLRAAEMLDHTKALQQQQMQMQHHQQMMQHAHAHAQPPTASSSSAPFGAFPAMMLMGPAQLDPKLLAAPMPGMPGGAFVFAPDAAVPDISSSVTPARESSPGVEDHDQDNEDDGASNDSSMSFGMDGDGDGDGKRSSRGMAAFKASRFNPRDSIAHNSVEKRRRAYLAACYDGLKCSIPALAGTRASNVKVLRAGAALIKSLESEDRRLAAEKKRLMAQREQLMQMNNQLASRLVQRRGHERAVPTLMVSPVSAAPTSAAAAAPFANYSPMVAAAAAAAMYAAASAQHQQTMVASAPVAAPAPASASHRSASTRERRPSESREVALSLMMLAGVARS